MADDDDGPRALAERPSCDAVAEATRVNPGGPAGLGDRDPGDHALFPRKATARASLADDAAAIDTLQDRLFAEGRRALLVVLQGIDTAGKGGVIRTVFKETGPRGVLVAPFGKPTPHELARDYLWRVHQVVPPKGFIGVFDRSHYEDVLIVRVRELAAADAVEARYEQINAFEKHLVETGTAIVKVMLHLSRKEQADNLRARLEDPAKHWKFNPADIEERKLWDAYQDAYEIALSRCSTPWAPWHVVPADSNSRRNATVARLVRGALERLDPQYPEADFDPSAYVIT